MQSQYAAPHLYFIHTLPTIPAAAAAGAYNHCNNDYRRAATRYVRCGGVGGISTIFRISALFLL